MKLPSPPLHLRFLWKYLQGDTSTVRNLPQVYKNELQKAIELPSGVMGGYQPSFVGPDPQKLPPDLRGTLNNATVTGEVNSTDWERLKKAGVKPSFGPSGVNSLYNEKPDSWKKVFGGHPALQVARTVGAFMAEPDTTKRVWKVTDRYQFDKTDEGRNQAVIAPMGRSAAITETPTFAIPRMIHGHGKPFDISLEVPMSQDALTKLRNFAASGVWR